MYLLPLGKVGLSKLISASVRFLSWPVPAGTISHLNPCCPFGLPVGNLLFFLAVVDLPTFAYLSALLKPRITMFKAFSWSNARLSGVASTIILFSTCPSAVLCWVISKFLSGFCFTSPKKNVAKVWLILLAIACFAGVSGAFAILSFPPSR